MTRRGSGVSGYLDINSLDRTNHLMALTWLVSRSMTRTLVDDFIPVNVTSSGFNGV